MPGNTRPLDADRLRQLRWRCGFTQEELAERAELTKRTIERAEAGNPVRASNLRRIAAALEVEPHTLLPGGCTETDEK